MLKLKPMNYHVLKERTRQDAESMARIYSVDRMLAENLTPKAFMLYFEMIFDAIDYGNDGETGNNICHYYKQDGKSLDRESANELIEKCLVSAVNENGVCQVLNWDCRQKKSDSSKDRISKHLEKRFNALIDELCAGRKKPEGLPEEVVVWGANNKRWGNKDDVRFADKLAKRIQKHVPDYVLGIADVNHARLIIRETGFNNERPRKAFRVIDDLAAGGGKLTMEKVRKGAKAVKDGN